MAPTHALTLHRVWAGMVACGWKPYEFRNSRPVALIGERVAIHAGHKEGATAAALKVLDRVAFIPAPDAGIEWIAPSWAFSRLCHAIKVAPAGHIIATAVVGQPIDLHADPYEDADPPDCGGMGGPWRDTVSPYDHLPLGYENTRWAIPLFDVHRLATPVPCRGSVTLGWRIPDDARTLIAAQTENAS